MELVQSVSSLETVIKELQSLLSTQFEVVASYVINQINSIPFNRKSVMFRGCFDTYDLLMTAFLYILEDKIHQSYKDMDKSTWYNLSSFRSEDWKIDGASLVAARKAMVSNVGLPSIIVTKHESLNNIRRPYYFYMDKSVENTACLPEVIVYIGNAYSVYYMGASIEPDNNTLI